MLSKIEVGRPTHYENGIMVTSCYRIDSRSKDDDSESLEKIGTSISTHGE